jgi:hypothetical protein
MTLRQARPPPPPPPAAAAAAVRTSAPFSFPIFVVEIEDDGTTALGANSLQ